MVQGPRCLHYSQYGMSLCVLGMAEEFRSQGVAVNALWPRTAILTAAMEMLGGGKGVADQCRKPEIMADAAYVILTKDSTSFTGNFAIDDTVLLESGETDLDQYACVPGSSLLPDFFLDVESSDSKEQQMGQGDIKDGGAESGPAKTFKAILPFLNQELVQTIGGVFEFNLSGKEEGVWYMDLKNGKGAIGKGSAPSAAECTMTMDSEDFTKMFTGSLKPTLAFMSGKLKMKGT
ncbi:hypothetical protein ScPMuIL_006970 [Solemya velum]